MAPVLEDPASLRYVARELRLDADQLCELTAGVKSATDGFAYEGPAAARFFDTMARARSATHAEAERLYALAQRLESVALEAEARIRLEAGQ